MNKKEGTKAKENNLEVRYANLEGQAGFLGGKRKKKEGHQRYIGGPLTTYCI